MRNLEMFADASFDLVYQPFSINFVPAVALVFAEVARISRPGAIYRMEWFNPFTQLVDNEQDWNGAGYLLRHEYIDGRESTELYPTWTVTDDKHGTRELDGPREFVHALSSVINSLAGNGFVILRAAESLGDGRDAEPGSWFHFMRVGVPYLTLWTRYHPNILR